MSDRHIDKAILIVGLAKDGRVHLLYTAKSGALDFHISLGADAVVAYGHLKFWFSTDDLARLRL